ncbi:MAG: hypothetical protein AB1502_04440 [Thermodesulfobacteriota bacterium]
MKAQKIIAIVIFFLAGTTFLPGYAFGQKAMNLPETAKKIKEKKINVGKIPNMDLENRFHNIHNKVLGLECESCHISNYAADYLYMSKYKLPERGSPGVVDRGICLGCHKANGPAATKLYGTADK